MTLLHFLRSKIFYPVSNALLRPGFSSAAYWDKRYVRGKTSGSGSYGRLATFKADVINEFVAKMGVDSVIEFGCGDGNQLQLYKLGSYVGLDVSLAAVERCRQVYRDDETKLFLPTTEYNASARYDMAMSIDVIFHLVEDAVFDRYLADTFDASDRYVCIYSSNEDVAISSTHVRHRRFTDWVAANRPEWALIDKVDNLYPAAIGHESGATSFADFYFYERRVPVAAAGVTAPVEAVTA